MLRVLSLLGRILEFYPDGLPMIMSQSKASTNYFDFAMSNNTNMVEIDGKDGNLYLHLQAMLYTIYAVLSFTLPNSSRR